MTGPTGIAARMTLKAEIRSLVEKYIDDHPEVVPQIKPFSSSLTEIVKTSVREEPAPAEPAAAKREPAAPVPDNAVPTAGPAGEVSVDDDEDLGQLIQHAVTTVIAAATDDQLGISGEPSKPVPEIPVDIAKEIDPEVLNDALEHGVSDENQSVLEQAEIGMTLEYVD